MKPQLDKIRAEACLELKGRKGPSGYIQWHAWAAKQKDKQVQCKCGCGRWFWLKQSAQAEARAILSGEGDK